MSLIARFVVRDDRTLIVGYPTKTSSLKPNTVYSLSDVSGEIILKEEGKSCIPVNRKDPMDAGFRSTWAHEIQNVITDWNRGLILTDKEYMQEKK